MNVRVFGMLSATLLLTAACGDDDGDTGGGGTIVTTGGSGGTSTDLKINHFWPQNYITAGSTGDVWYDDMVLATERIGCIVPN